MGNTSIILHMCNNDRCIQYYMSDCRLLPICSILYATICTVAYSLSYYHEIGYCRILISVPNSSLTYRSYLIVNRFLYTTVVNDMCIRYCMSDCRLLLICSILYATICAIASSLSYYQEIGYCRIPISVPNSSLTYRSYLIDNWFRYRTVVNDRCTRYRMSNCCQYIVFYMRPFVRYDM